MAADAYSDALLAHLRAPRGAGGFAADTAGVYRGEAGDLDTERWVRIEIRIGADGRIAEARFKAFGCPATIACASALVERIAKRTLEEAEGVSPAEVARALELPAARRPAAESAVAALAGAVARARAAAT